MEPFISWPFPDNPVTAFATGWAAAIALVLCAQKVLARVMFAREKATLEAFHAGERAKDKACWEEAGARITSGLATLDAREGQLIRDRRCLEWNRMRFHHAVTLWNAWDTFEAEQLLAETGISDWSDHMRRVH